MISIFANTAPLRIVNCSVYSANQKSELEVAELADAVEGSRRNGGLSRRLLVEAYLVGSFNAICLALWMRLIC